jgi:hypothetical protein
VECYLNLPIEEILEKHKPNLEAEKWKDINIDDAQDEHIE